MTEESQQTPPENPQGTGEPAETPPTPATQESKDKGAATDGEDTVTLQKADYQKLVSQRDKNHERATATENYVAELAQKDAINEFLGTKEAKEKFPDVKTSDLMVAMDPEDFPDIAAQTQARFDEVVQKRLSDTEIATDPVLSPEERSAQEKKLKASPGVSSLERAIALRSKQQR